MLKVKSHKILMALIVSLVSHAAIAVEVSKINRVVLPIHSQDTLERKNAIKQGLSDLVVRLSGQTSAIELPAVQNLLENAADYVKSTRYFSKTTQGELPQKFIEITYQEKAIEHYFLQHQIPFWQHERPLLLVWLIQQQNNTHVLLADDDAQSIHTTLKQQATSRGIPIAFPILDLTDRETINLDATINEVNQSIIQASKRYHANFILIGQLENQSNDPTTNWYFFTKDSGLEKIPLSNSSASLSAQSAIDHVGEKMGAEFAVVNTSETQASQVFLTISGLNHYFDFQQLENYLNEISTINAIKLISFSQEKATFEISSNTSAEKLKKLLSLNQHLSNADDNSELGLNTLKFIWQP